MKSSENLTWFGVRGREPVSREIFNYKHVELSLDPMLWLHVTDEIASKRNLLTWCLCTRYDHSNGTFVNRSVSKKKYCNDSKHLKTGRFHTEKNLNFQKKKMFSELPTVNTHGYLPASKWVPQQPGFQQGVYSLVLWHLPHSLLVLERADFAHSSSLTGTYYHKFETPPSKGVLISFDKTCISCGHVKTFVQFEGLVQLWREEEHFKVSIVIGTPTKRLTWHFSHINRVIPEAESRTLIQIL